MFRVFVLLCFSVLKFLITKSKHISNADLEKINELLVQLTESMVGQV